MIVKFLDKFGKLVKSITSIAYIPVDVEPVEGSGHLLSSGAGASISSNFAPNYTKQTYEANSYVMHDGVLYTNENAIGTAEDWNPAHWTQTTVAEMMAGAGGNTGYTQRNVNASVVDNVYTLARVSNRSVTVASSSQDSTLPWKITIDNNCTDAVVILRDSRNYSMNPRDIEIVRDGTPLTRYGTKGQMVSGSVEGDACGFDFTPLFNGIGESSYGGAVVIIRICGDIALLSFTVA